MKINKEEYNTLLGELVSVIPEPISPEEITVDMFVKASGYSRNGARQYLLSLVESGVLEKGRTLMNGKMTNVYKKV